MQGKVLTGSRIREQRTRQGIRQTDLAATAGISASYLNLIEHNRRRVAGTVLDRLAKALGTEADALEAGAQGGLLDDLRNAAAAIDGTAELGRLEEFAGRFPGWADLVAVQYRRGQVLERNVEAFHDRMTHDPYLSTTLHEVLQALSSVRATAGILAENIDLDAETRGRFLNNLHSDAERLSEGAQALVAYLDGSERPTEGIASPQDEVETWIAALGWQVGDLDAETLVRLNNDLARLASPGARVLAATWLSQVAHDAALLPLAKFRAALAEFGPDPALLARHFGVGILSVFRRLALMPGSTFGVVICDGSGAMTFRKPVAGFSLPRFGAACPLWPVFTALSRPMMAVSAVVEMAGPMTRRFGVQAFCQVTQTGGFGTVEVREAAMLIRPQLAGTGEPVRIGPTCRICTWRNCVARREPSILTLDA